MARKNTTQANWTCPVKLPSLKGRCLYCGRFLKGRYAHASFCGKCVKSGVVENHSRNVDRLTNDKFHENRDWYEYCVSGNSD